MTIGYRIRHGTGGTHEAFDITEAWESSMVINNDMDISMLTSLFFF